MLFVGAGIRLLDGKDLIKKNVFSLRLKETIVSQLWILNGTEFQVVAAECLKARDAIDLGQVVASRS